jgi:hypothetical protein
MYEVMAYWETAHTLPDQLDERRFGSGVVYLRYRA